MKTIKVFIASSEELKLERLEFVDVIQNLNHALKPRGVEIEPIKWEYIDASMNAERKQTEYNNALRECEMCLVMYWTKFGEFTEEELTTAWESLKKGDNPRKLYVYFKEPSDVTPELQTFKESFVTKYGHFYCKFENVDTMSLNFLLQFEQYQSARHEQDPIIQIKDSKVLCGNIPVANLNNVPFAGNNPDYLKLREDLQEIQEDIVSDESALAAAPDEDLERKLLRKRFKREKLTKELEEMEKSLMNTAKQIVSLSYTASSARLLRAVELFEKGDNKGANAVLDFDEIKAEMAQNAIRIDQARELEQAALEALKSNIEECKLKVKTLQTEKEEGWLEKCCEIYEDALRQAEGRMKDEEVVELRFDYALLLQDNKKFHRSEELYEANVAVCRQLAEQSPEAYMPDIACNIGNLAILHQKLNRHEQAEQEYEEAISIYLKMALYFPEAYMPDVARNVGNLAILHKDLNRYEQAEQKYEVVISLYRQLAEQSPDIYMPDVARSIGNLANFHLEMERYEQAEQEYEEAISIYRKLPDQSLEAYMPRIARNISNLAILHKNLRRYEQAEQEYEEAISICLKLEEKSPDVYQHDLARNIDNLVRFHRERHLYRYGQSERENGEATSLYRQLAEKMPEAYLHDLARNVSLQAIHNRRRNVELAEQEFAMALNFYRKLAEQFSEAYLPRVASKIVDLANLHRDLHRYELAEQEYEEAISIYRKLVEQFPAQSPAQSPILESYLHDVARNIENLADLHSDLRQYEQSEQEYKEAISIYRKLAECSPFLHLPDVARNIGKLANLHRKLQRYEQAEQEYEEAISIYEQAEQEYEDVISLATTESEDLSLLKPKPFLPTVAICINDLSHTYSFQGKLELAIATIEKAIAIAPDNPHYLDSKGEFLLELGRTDEALAIYHQILEMDADFFKKSESELEKGLKEKGMI